ncbi:MAG: ferritin family protein [Negativicutes bacterium]
MNDENSFKKAFTIEAEHHVEYSTYAEIAHREGRHEAARIFRAAAMAELIHAKRQMAIVEKLQTTDKNLEKAINNEAFEINELYPQLTDEAKKINNFAALTSLEDAEKSDKKLISILIEHQRKAFETKHIYFVCNTCGFIAIDTMTTICPVCQDENALWHEVR